MSRSSRLILHGAIAGAIAATVVAVWFLIIDVAAGRPLYTPRFLAGALLDLGGAGAGTTTVVLYTIAHYVVFIALGIATAALLGSVPLGGGILFGIIVGFLLFDLVFYIGLIASGSNVILELGWPVVLIGCVLAGIALVVYLSVAGPVRHEGWLRHIMQERTLREGIIAGILGATAVAVWFLIVDAIAGHLLLTPAALGSAAFYGATGPGQVHADVATIAGYTLLHYVAFILTGIIAAALLRGSEESPPLFLGSILLFVTVEALFVGLVAIIANWVLGFLAWWTIALGNIVGAVAMGIYLWRAHPVLRHKFDRLEEPV